MGSARRRARRARAKFQAVWEPVKGANHAAATAALHASEVVNRWLLDSMQLAGVDGHPPDDLTVARIDSGWGQRFELRDRSGKWHSAIEVHRPTEVSGEELSITFRLELPE